MKALLLKELYTTKKIIPVIIIGILLSCGLSAFMHDEKYIVGLFMLILSSVSIILIFNNDKSGWKSYSKIFPYTKAQMVSAKYITVIFTLAAITAIYVLYRVIFINVTYSLYAYLTPEDTLALFSAELLSAGITIPLMYLLGGTIGMIVSIYTKLNILVCSGIWLVFCLMIVEDSGYDYWLAVFAVICAVLFALSWPLSIKIYKKKNQ